MSYEPGMTHLVTCRAYYEGDQGALCTCGVGTDGGHLKYCDYPEHSCTCNQERERINEILRDGR